MDRVASPTLYSLLPRLRVGVSTLLVILLANCSLPAEVVSVGNRRFEIPDGYELQLATTPGLTARPIVVDFDSQGNLYVAESSGTNDNVHVQLETKPHKILRLTDTDLDGVFDQRTVFADQMMFPEGTLWHEGSLYVAAPPQIWKLTDTDGDGVADRREIWFDAKTLTGCANDLHGPYLGRDGWIYWCKGAFAEQTYQRPDAAAFVTRAAHIFRRRPTGGTIEAVMTGGMDNPVEVAFSPVGERFFTTTFFQHPASGQRDGLVHAVYGGVYGKQHGVIDGHPRTGDLMPVMTHLGAAAPSGLCFLESDGLRHAGDLVSACFNLHAVFAHELVAQGATFRTEDARLVSTDDLDFHPTDVVEDADGSLLIVDTGGWYKLCCPTSQLHKPDVLGAIYRLRKKDAIRVEDPRGRGLSWETLAPTELVSLLGDSRFAVRNRAVARLREFGASAVPALVTLWQQTSNPQARLHAVWAACGIDGQAARALVRDALRDHDVDVQTAAVHAVSVWRDSRAATTLHQLLLQSSLPLRRAVAEALGRIGNDATGEALVTAIDPANDRVLEHSITYAMIELRAAAAAREARKGPSSAMIRTGLWALHAIEPDGLQASELAPLLLHTDPDVRETSTRIAYQRPQWGAAFADVLRNAPQTPEVAQLVSRLDNSAAVRDLALAWLQDDQFPSSAKTTLIASLDPNRDTLAWNHLVEELLKSQDLQVVEETVKHVAEVDQEKIFGNLQRQLKTLAADEGRDGSIRLWALHGLPKITDPDFAFAMAKLIHGENAGMRGLAASLLQNVSLSRHQVLQLAEAFREVGPLELSRVVSVFASEDDAGIGKQLVASMLTNDAIEALPIGRIAELTQQFGTEVAALAAPLLTRADVSLDEQARYLDDLLENLPQGDVRRGQTVFHSEQASCFACHVVGYRGGTVGPDLSRIARIRSRRDLLEAIVFPSASFVRSYEPVMVVTTAGKTFTGTIRDQGAQQVVLQLNATEQVTIPVSDIETMLPGQVSVMPAGLEKQMSRQALADLLAFLATRK